MDASTRTKQERMARGPGQHASINTPYTGRSQSESSELPRVEDRKSDERDQGEEGPGYGGILHAARDQRYDALRSHHHPGRGNAPFVDD